MLNDPQETSQPPEGAVAAESHPELRYEGLSRTSELPSCLVSLDDFRKLHKDLRKLAQEAADAELDKIPKPADWDDARFQSELADHKQAAGVTVIVIGVNGEQLVSTDADALDSDRLPDRIEQVSFDSSFALQNRKNWRLLNRFELVVDFTGTPDINIFNPWSESTPSASTLTVTGPSLTWVAAVHERVTEFFRNRRKHRAWLHNTVTFNLIQWLIAFPASLWFAFRVDTSLTRFFTEVHPAIQGAIYVYLVLSALLISRLTLFALRWTYPLVEIEGSKNRLVRGGANAVAGAFVIGFICDVVREILSRI